MATAHKPSTEPIADPAHSLSSKIRLSYDLYEGGGGVLHDCVADNDATIHYGGNISWGSDPTYGPILSVPPTDDPVSATGLDMATPVVLDEPGWSVELVYRLSSSAESMGRMLCDPINDIAIDVTSFWTRLWLHGETLSRVLATTREFDVWEHVIIVNHYDAVTPTLTAYCNGQITSTGNLWVPWSPSQLLNDVLSQTFVGDIALVRLLDEVTNDEAAELTADPWCWCVRPKPLRSMAASVMAAARCRGMIRRSFR